MRTRTLFLGLLLTAAIAAAQDWRGGRARVEGTVRSGKGDPIEGCKVSLRWGRSSHGGPDLTTDKQGRFAIFGLAGGPWDVDFEAAGYQTKKITVSLQEGGRNAPIDVQLDPQPKSEAPAPAAAPQILVGGKKISKETADAIEAGNAAMAARNWTAARESYLKALTELPDNGALLERIAGTYLADNKPDEALTYARQATEKDPSDAVAWRMVAEIELQKGNLEAGQAALDKVPADKLNDPQPYLNVGILLLNKKKPAEAVGALDKAIAIKPDLADAYYYRGLCYMQMKKNAEAKADLRKALELAPDGPDAKDIKDLLKTLP
ncbi:MAG TPA: tetratricopeptide repeat protein [Thermoanaerobaculia bacterium]|jgi:tetratricopeptide (TPR) repeat protein|nr:tetratricopeptide repeat protein [Thermoanaerobaculia bacterium]